MLTRCPKGLLVMHFIACCSLLLLLLFAVETKASRASCDDNILNGDEEDVDCGGGECEPCPVDPTCTDGIHNGGEEGVDCGGPCSGVCPTCGDEAHNGDELGVDCGGSCGGQCPSCIDGEHNGDETSVDCGGACGHDHCPSCADDMFNGDEEGTDCGGSCNTTCAPTCFDGWQNGDETGINCGGPECEACGSMKLVQQPCYYKMYRAYPNNPTALDSNVDPKTLCCSISCRQSLFDDEHRRLERDDEGVVLTGTIPAVLGELVYLTDLHLKDNDFTGTIPPELSKLTNLERTLDLSWNKLTGTLPGEIVAFCMRSRGPNIAGDDVSYALENVLDLDAVNANCNFRRSLDIGKIQTFYLPTNVSAMTELTSIDAANMASGVLDWDSVNVDEETNEPTGGILHFIGTIPTEFGTLTNLQYLDLRSTMLTGNIPPLANLLNLDHMSFDRSALLVPPLCEDTCVFTISRDDLLVHFGVVSSSEALQDMTANAQATGSESELQYLYDALETNPEYLSLIEMGTLACAEFETAGDDRICPRFKTKLTHNGVCEDGGSFSSSEQCGYGSDCSDCGARPMSSTRSCGPGTAYRVTGPVIGPHLSSVPSCSRAEATPIEGERQCSAVVTYPCAGCYLCPVGRWNSVTNNTECSGLCPAGKHGTHIGGIDETSACAFCSPGFFAAGASATACERCASGTFAAGEGRDAPCEQCAPGQYAVPSRTACEICPAGWFSENGHDECTQCPAGFVAPDPGQGMCQVCTQFAAPDGTACDDCLPGRYGGHSGTAGCTDCPTGYVSVAAGLATCHLCSHGRFADSSRGAKECLDCPLHGFKCSGGLLLPLDGFWTPPGVEGEDSFTPNTVVFSCLTKASCVANHATATTRLLTPATAYNCSEGHMGVLCAECRDNFYFKEKRCLRCDDAAVSPHVVPVVIVVLSLAACYVVFRVASRMISREAKTACHAIRKEIHDEATRRQKRQPSVAQQLATKIRIFSVRLVRSSVKSANEHIVEHSETLRVVLGFAKIITHLFSTLSYCFWLPSAMDGVLAVSSLIIFDIFNETRLPCFVPNFSFYTKVLIVTVAPLVLVGVLFVGGVLIAVAKREREIERQESMLEELHIVPIVKQGMWMAAAPALFFLDLLWPTITRTLFSFFSCRNLGSSGKWLEASYGVACDDDRYAANYYWVLAAASSYALLVPALIYGLARRFEDRGRAGDKKVELALGFAYLPYRPGRNWWLIAENARVLLLTSMVGFMSSSCWVKLLAAQTISLVFFAVFAAARPYKFAFLNVLQGVTMLIPAISLGYGLSGGWENADRNNNVHGTLRRGKDDGLALVALHVSIVIPPAALALMTVGSTLFVWAHAKKRGGAVEDAPPSSRSNAKGRAHRHKKKEERRESIADDWSSWSSFEAPDVARNAHEPDVGVGVAPDLAQANDHHHAGGRRASGKVRSSGRRSTTASTRARATGDCTQQHRAAAARATTVDAFPQMQHTPPSSTGSGHRKKKGKRKHKGHKGKLKKSHGKHRHHHHHHRRKKKHADLHRTDTHHHLHGRATTVDAMPFMQHGGRGAARAADKIDLLAAVAEEGESIAPAHGKRNSQISLAHSQRTRTTGSVRSAGLSASRRTSASAFVRTVPSRRHSERALRQPSGAGANSRSGTHRRHSHQHHHRHMGD